VSLNPAEALDPLGIIGHAKPVPVEFGALRNPRRDMVWAAAAGPAINLSKTKEACD
jgi:hypothetical protein